MVAFPDDDGAPEVREGVVRVDELANGDGLRILVLSPDGGIIRVDRISRVSPDRITFRSPSTRWSFPSGTTLITFFPRVLIANSDTVI